MHVVLIPFLAAYKLYIPIFAPISKKYSLENIVEAHKDLEARLLTGPADIIP